MGLIRGPIPHCHLCRLQANELDALAGLRSLLSYLPSSNRVKAPRVPCFDPANRPALELDSIVPSAEFEPYDMMDVLQAVMDNREFFELHKGVGPRSRVDGATMHITLC